MPSFTVENYLKAIYHLAQKTENGVTTNAIADHIGTKAATVSDMLKKLAAQNLINYKKYQGTRLTMEGRSMAINIIRKHRLWEVFLVEKLNFSWDEVHDIAEDLEHIESLELVNRLEEFLDHPKFDPHGDPIPDREGNIFRREQKPLSEMVAGNTGIVTGVKDSSKSFLQYLDTLGIQLGDELKVIEVFEYDNSRIIEFDNHKLTLSQQASKNLFVTTEQ